MRLNIIMYKISLNYILQIPFIYLFSPFRNYMMGNIKGKEHKIYMIDNPISQNIGYKFRSRSSINKEQPEALLFIFNKEKEVTVVMDDVNFPIALYEYDLKNKGILKYYCILNENESIKIKTKCLLEVPVIY